MSKDTQHTPGPWEIVQDGGALAVKRRLPDGQGYEFLAGDYGETISAMGDAVRDARDVIALLVSRQGGTDSADGSLIALLRRLTELL